MAHLLFRPTFEIPFSEGALRILLEALIDINLMSIRAQAYPLLYESGVYYQAEEPGFERFLSIPSVIDQGYGDCEDLACWRIAELRHRGQYAVPYLILTRTDDRLRYHIAVSLSNNVIEDPSDRLS